MAPSDAYAAKPWKQEDPVRHHDSQETLIPAIAYFFHVEGL